MSIAKRVLSFSSSSAGSRRSTRVAQRNNRPAYKSTNTRTAYKSTAANNRRGKVASAKARSAAANRKTGSPKTPTKTSPPPFATPKKQPPTTPAKAPTTPQTPPSPAKLSLPEQQFLRFTSSSPSKTLPQSPYTTPTKHPWTHVADTSSNRATVEESKSLCEERSEENRRYFAPISQYKLMVGRTTSVEANKVKRCRLNNVTKALIRDHQITVSRTSRVSTASSGQASVNLTLPNYQTKRFNQFVPGKRGPFTRCARIVPLQKASGKEHSTTLRRSWRNLSKLIGRQLFTSPLTVVDESSAAEQQ